MDSNEKEQYNMREKAIYDRISALGKAEEKLEVAKKLLITDVDINIIISSTGLNKE